MKKLMILAAAIATTAIVNAASVTWSAQVTASSGVTTGYYAVLVDASAYATLDAAVAAIVKNGTAADGVMASAAAVYNKGNVLAGISNKTLPAEYDANQSVGYWTIIFDGSIGKDATAKNYYNTAATVTDIDASGSTVISAAGKLVLSQGVVANGEWQAIPEPTSGLLMLLGVAGLALRRKRS